MIKYLIAIGHQKFQFVGIFQFRCTTMERSDPSLLLISNGEVVLCLSMKEVLLC